MKLSSLKNSSTVAALAVTTAAIVSMPVAAEPNNAPSYIPGPDTVTSPCEGSVRFTQWAQNVSDGDGETSGLRFLMTGTSNADIFSDLPFVSWPSLTLGYQIKPGTPGGIVSNVSAVLIDTSGTGQGGQDTSVEQTWTITTEGCTDADLDGIADEIDPEITPLVDTDGDGIFDVLDDDDDNDGISDADEGNGLVDTDADGIADSLDTDSDNDGTLDADETGDSDQDGIGDSQEPNGTDVTTDTDGDGITDDIDTDDDGDGILDSDEGDGVTDTDGDSIPDSLDPDSDNDGIGDDGNPVQDTPVTPQSGDSDSLIETGLNGGGCSLSTGAAFDPMLILMGLLALIGLGRRRV